MNSKKEYEVKIRKFEKKIKELEKKLERSKSKNTDYSQEQKYLKQRIKELMVSRKVWKVKLQSKQEEIKLLQAKIVRWGKAKGHHYPTQLVGLCILLRIIGGCSYGGICRILGILNGYMGLGLTKLPCANTIQNWVSKMGLFTMKQGAISLQGKEVSLIIDESIRLGQEKLLLILSIPFEKVKNTALSFQDVEVVYMKGAISWTGQKIKQVLEELKLSHGFEIKSIVSDEDSKLLKACRLAGIVHVPDISHAVATCLRKVFEKAEEFICFKNLISSYASKGVNQELSYLCPPKQRTKARFMNLSKVVKWANSMLERTDKLNKVEAEFFKDLSGQIDFLGELKRCLAVAKHICLPLKLKGLSKQTIKQAQEQIIALNVVDGYLGDFLKHLQSYLVRYQETIFNGVAVSIHVSSEIIESMFGKYKSKANNYALTGLTSLNLELPIYGTSIEQIPQQMTEALEAISIANLNKWKKDNSTESQLVKRQKFFEKGK